ncbi:MULTISPECIES: LLM class flavin-dependent oxidoreductase [Agrobacterium]|uniref:LLM class flavin-dependent oxidoreductase n=1 Tax=Agrobacterium rubi TaxID=28099 RepID=A0AAE7RBM7_9HYPH|nr:MULTISPECIES: LLM class flavin-dependent oxidoreductase [Agrobacterium]MBN7808936.1 LLM class flavin-dependent oxidoreductase [Agrobacterium rosae]NTE89862.1 LLM class flavin-dependent oxidoreductase [Agrobacterium rubi]NTF05288.1 LLM class flavin-dependent oxidoreductase [Agrobacterium rubi]NTF10538.1 LLM class flavin-dependent oxidoreductase [Agrobacterium rubi]NTF22932.1 LLM class flavin-dependent oxidoreductase [Agrobacterium rubi]
MKFSVIFSFVAPPDSTTTHRHTFAEYRRLLPLVEDLGYHGIHMTEHHFQADGYNPSPILTLAMAAGVTKKVKLATNILISSLYAPVQLLEDLSMLDNLSDGRLILGTSPGYASEEFAGRGIAYADRFKLHEEIIDFLQHGWENPEDIGFESSMIKVPSVRLSPRPVQARLPIWYGVSGPKLLVKAAKRRAVLVASPRHTTAELQEHYSQYVAACGEEGFTPTERPIFRECLVLDSVDEAEHHAAIGTNGIFGIYGRKSAEGERSLHTDSGDLVTDEGMVQFRAMSSRYIVGDPQLAIEKIQALKDALNPTEVVLRMQMPGVPTERIERSLRLFAEKVMPHFA